MKEKMFKLNNHEISKLCSINLSQDQEKKINSSNHISIREEHTSNKTLFFF